MVQMSVKFAVKLRPTAAESATRADVAALAAQVAELHRILVGMQAGERAPDQSPARREGGAAEAIRSGR